MKDTSDSAIEDAPHSGAAATAQKALLEGFASRLFPHPARISNLQGSGMALFLSLLKAPFIMVEASEDEAERLHRDMLFFRGLFPVSGAPRPEVLYLPAGNSPAAHGQRALVGLELATGPPASVVTSAEALNAGLWPPEELEKAVVQLRLKMEKDRTLLASDLHRAGYMAAPLVTAQGQYSLRQWLLDIFPSTADHPIRVEFFGDTVESIRLFSIESQRSLSPVQEFTVFPASGPDTGQGIAAFTGGLDVFASEEAAPEAAPETAHEMLEPSCVLSRFAISGGGMDSGLLNISGLGVLPDERKDVTGLVPALKVLAREHRVVLVSSSEGQAERLKDILMDGDTVAPVLGRGEVLSFEGRMCITVGKLSAGFFMPGLIILTEAEIFRKPKFRAIKKSSVSGLLSSLEDLAQGDLVVHRDHGVGRFSGISRQSIEGHECDLLCLDYNGGRLYLPLDSIALVHKYRTSEGVTPQLDTLGGKAWKKTREKVRKKIRVMADRLLKLYAVRDSVTRAPFSPDTLLHQEFDSFFLYEETPDQARSTHEIKQDMEAQKPMDRLLCGDVGYGKTEVAMKAAFKAVYDSKQVAVVVPTTLLCEQHVRTFKNRFSAFPVKVDSLSRFKSKKQQDAAVKAVEGGETDILIGTHALIKRRIKFPNLGLLIVDEEHRFGVAQKERLKEFKKGVDVLAMTATPIPRTLQMAISGIRSMSTIETPPEERLAVRTMVSTFNLELIKEAVSKEARRGGQVFFVHNRIKDIDDMAQSLRRLLPELRYAVAHGQMPEGRLEKIMLSFLNGEVDVLVSTAIISSGLDIPSANTIIVNMADRMGMADLYQLRGRVGRSSRRAYAFFLVPGWDIITEEARQRLHALQELSYLGAGFRLAMKDLEIRGAGNLLGAEQSGNINAVGFDLYIEMLESAVSELKGEPVRDEAEASVDLTLDAFIPESYIEDMMLRLTAYRKVAAAREPKDLESAAAEMRDRFGRPPEEFLSLLKVMALKLACMRLRVAELHQIGATLKFTFIEEADVPMEKILKACGRRVKFVKDGFKLALGSSDAYKEAAECLEAMAPDHKVRPDLEDIL